ncbi:MAG TPA: hypothetical protein H9793_00760 [Candidatus Brevibacterium intestinigallinarum]|nr:hypothetical protein [Candidatus Brevibacterium intestinigallinarum]
MSASTAPGCRATDEALRVRAEVAACRTVDPGVSRRTEEVSGGLRGLDDVCVLCQSLAHLAAGHEDQAVHAAAAPA